MAALEKRTAAMEQLAQERAAAQAAVQRLEPELTAAAAALAAARSQVPPRPPPPPPPRPASPAVKMGGVSPQSLLLRKCGLGLYGGCRGLQPAAVCVPSDAGQSASRQG